MENKTFDLMYFENHFHHGKCMMKVDGATAYLSENDDCYLMTFYPDDGNPCCRQLRFDSVTLRIVEEGCFLYNGSERIGEWVEYDPEGHVSNRTDFDQEHFPFKWEKVAALLKEKGLGYDDMQIITRSIQPDGRGVWKVMAFRKPHVQEDISIDGIDGTILAWDEKQVRSESNFRKTLTTE